MRLLCRRQAVLDPLSIVTVHLKLHFPILLLLILLGPSWLMSQSAIAITIDDVPNTRSYAAAQGRAHLLAQLDSLSLPIAIFVNEGQLYKTPDFEGNLQLLDMWVGKSYTTLGNHTYAHSRYSEVGLDSFVKDMELGAALLEIMAGLQGKELRYFRFPYNDLGLDALQHQQIDSVLQRKNYINAPFTAESSDWMFNAIYEYHLARGEDEKAQAIGELYLHKTIDYIQFYDSISQSRFGRQISQIYLCHDNLLNAAYLPKILCELTKLGYKFISLDEALQDPAYRQKDLYAKKWGISWHYRWMTDQAERRAWMEREPNIDAVEAQFEQIK
jgi:peptidoglycan-N-acetylglucosamine deacetylase